MTTRETHAPQGRAPEPTTYDRRMYTLMNGGQARSFHATVVRRRVVVCTHIALTALVVAAGVTGSFAKQQWALYALLALLLPWCFATGVINSATRGLLELRGRVLDERQLAERDRVLARAHRVTLFLLLTATIAAGTAGWFGDVPTDVPGEALVVPVLVAVLVVHWLMPLWVAGLVVRDEPAED
ncbi:hypothetical protein ACIOJD_04915 [Streptomyces sp. NPDC088116]|uniref:hypothetical protein n=1 Tax=Streptomyces sp. NPDC088116 TaxID=3365825 RepID=UPI003813C00E